MFTPVVPLDAAEPWLDAVEAAPPAVTVQLEYVYLLRVVTRTVVKPSAKIPAAQLPAAEPAREAVVAAVAAAFTSPE